VNPRLNQRWSTRRAHINTRRQRTRHPIPTRSWPATDPGRNIAPGAAGDLETRDPKYEPRSLTEQRSTWLDEVAVVLGGRGAVAAMVQTALAPAVETAMVPDGRWVEQTADHVLAVMEESRSTWQIWHVRARHNARCAPRMCLSSGQVCWWICWSMRCWIAGLSPLSRRVMASTNRKRCGARRRIGLHRGRCGSLHLATDPRRRAAARRRWRPPRRVSGR
jgi:hypothetical protein